MVLRPLRPVPLPGRAQAIYDDWLQMIEGRLAEPEADWYALCREVLFEIWHPGQGSYADAKPTTPTAQAALAALDPHCITLEPEYYAEVDVAKFARVKPLLWLWYSFDRSPMGGQHVDLGVRLRRLLAPRIFARCGANFKAFQHVEFSFGYNMEVGDDVVVHRHVLLDDRGGITLGNRVATEFIPAPDVEAEHLAEAAQLASLADETPFGLELLQAAAQRAIGDVFVVLGLECVPDLGALQSVGARLQKRLDVFERCSDLGLRRSWHPVRPMGLWPAGLMPAVSRVMRPYNTNAGHIFKVCWP